MQQAVKPLGYPRGGVLSPEGFQRLHPQNLMKKKNVSDFQKEKGRRKFMIHFYKNLDDLLILGYSKLFLLFISFHLKSCFQLRLSFQE